jgi:hypothetical protein
MHGSDNRIHVPEDWINDPTDGALFAGQTLATGNVAPTGATAKRYIIYTGGDLYLIPPGATSLVGVLFGPVTAGMVIDQQAIGVGSSNTAVLVAQFN